MNRNRRPIANKTRKKMEKQVKKGQKKLSAEKPLRTDELTPRKALKKYPPKRRKVEKPLMESTIKQMQIKKTKKMHKESKRTNPGDVPHRESPPASIHPESERWEKTLVKQNKIDRKILTTKLQRRKSKK